MDSVKFGKTFMTQGTKSKNPSISIEVLVFLERSENNLINNLENPSTTFDFMKKKFYDKEKKFPVFLRNFTNDFIHIVISKTGNLFRGTLWNLYF